MSASSVLDREDAPACCEDEEWKPLPGWPHEVSTCGRVRSIDRIDAAGRLRFGAELARRPDKRKGKGYLYATLIDGPRRRKAAVAVLVLEAHRELRPGPGYEACHNRGVRTDNHLPGLRWDTKAANRADREKHRQERAVTGAVTTLPEIVRSRHRLQVRRGEGPRPGAVTATRHSDAGSGTGRSPLPFSFPSVPLFLNPLSILRSLRSRRIPR